MKDTLRQLPERGMLGCFWLLVLYALFQAWTGLGPRWPLLALPLAFVILALVSINMNRHVAKEANRPLEEDCDPEPFLAYIQGKCQDAHPPSSLIYWVNWASLLYILGRQQEGDQILFQAQVLLSPKEKDHGNIFYRQVKISRYISQGLLDQAQQELSDLDDILDDLGTRADSLKEYQPRLKLDLRIAQGGVDPTLESDLRLALAKDQTLYQKVCDHMRLGKYYMKYQDPEAARLHLEFVVAHGNKLYVRQEAEELLAQLPQLEAQG